MFVQLNRFLAGCVAGCALLLVAPSAFAQYPARAVRMSGLDDVMGPRAPSADGKQVPPFA
jgi:hypothetical protein